MLLAFLLALVPPDDPRAPQRPAEPDPEAVPPGVPFQEPPEPDVPEGPGVSDPDLAPGAPPAPSERPPARRRVLPDDRMDHEEDPDAPFDTAALPPDHPAYDRIQTRGERPPTAGPRPVTVLTAVALLAAGLLVAYALVRPDPVESSVPDLLTLVAAHTGTARLDVQTSDLDEAEAFIIGEFGWPIRVPVFPDARLEGVGVAALSEGVEVPVLRYRTDDAGAPIVVYAYDYAFLDAASDRLRLAPPVYARLADDPPVDVRRVGDQYLVLWRRRAAIYTAVTDDDPGALAEYLRRR
ncbi:MAG: hypothetical protein R3181_03030 [Rubricoccaceae bacterium]|nr:hypothetical protein [Rubricoccaceae bacterium]